MRFKVSEVGLHGGRRGSSRELVSILCGAGQLCPHWGRQQAPPRLFTEPRAASAAFSSRLWRTLQLRIHS